MDVGYACCLWVVKFCRGMGAFMGEEGNRRVVVDLEGVFLHFCQLAKDAADKLVFSLSKDSVDGLHVDGRLLCR